MIFITSMCFNLMSDGLRSAMDVKSEVPAMSAVPTCVGPQ
jgi:hypothetical protein